MMQERIEKMEEDRRTVERVKLEELEEERNSKRRHEETEALEQKLNKIQPLINEANLCAKEFGRDIYFKAKLVTVIPETLNKSPLDEFKNRKTEIRVKVYNNEESYTYLWSLEDFQERIILIRELVNQFYENGQSPEFTVEDDPFFDPPEP